MSRMVRRSAPVLVVVLLVVPLVLVGCGRGDDGAKAGGPATFHWDIEPSPPKRGPATVTVHLEDEAGAPREGATLTVEGNMNHAGMRPVFSDLTETEPGTYVSDSFEFTMGGDWILTVRGTLSDGTSFEQVFDVDGVDG